MKSITFRADEKLIEAARERAEAQHTTLNEQFRQWLAEYALGLPEYRPQQAHAHWRSARSR